MPLLFPLLLGLLALPIQARDWGLEGGTVPVTVLLLEPGLENGLPKGWEVQVFPKIERRTRYEASMEDGRFVVRAEAEASASGWRLRRRVDLRKTPLLRWRWKVVATPEGEDPRKKSGDDYGARIYIIFEKPWRELSFFEKVKMGLVEKIYGERPPTAAINYIWSGALERGTALPNPYTDRVRMIAVRGKEDPLGRWYAEERNLAEDYQWLFKESPPAVVGFSLMTDADNTGGHALAFYADLELLPLPR